MKDIDLTKPIRHKLEPDVACKYVGLHYGFYWVVGSDGVAGNYSLDEIGQEFENIPEAPWYPDDSGDWIEGGVEMLPSNVVTFEALFEGERELKNYGETILNATLPLRVYQSDIVAVKPLTVRYPK